MGNGSVIYKDEVQVMSAGTGITHSEFNPSKDERVGLLQIWIIPNKRNVKPRYDQNKFVEETRKNQVKLVVSGKNENGLLMIHQEAALSLGHLEKGKTLDYSLHYKNNGVYLFVIEGELKIGDEELFRRDAIGISGKDIIKIEAQEETRFVVIEVPMN
jgi:redox-sensitive bicupin YhaK (pirin superfamily)